MGMYGSLIPTSGGKTIPLPKQRVLIGRASGSDRSTPLTEQNACCLLERIDGWWHVEDLNCPQALKINGRPVKRDRLMTGDEIDTGKHRFRINFDIPKGGASGNRSAPISPPQRTASEIQQQRRSAPLGRLVPVGGGTVFQLTKPQVTIGRRQPCEVVIPAKTVSSRHCELILKDGYWWAQDLDSRNGIHIDGRRCDEGWVLPHHRLSVATERFLLEYDGEGPPPAMNTFAADVKKSLLDRLGLSEDVFDDAKDSDLPGRRRRPL